MPFAEILGQDRAVSQLCRARAAGRLAQAYCFAGPPGVGKRTTALALAQAVNCLVAGSGAVDACGTCAVCRRIAAGVHPDVTEVRPEGKTVITIDQIRELAARAGLRAYEGKVKVWILDPADQMQEPAANAFLKTLEEPAGASLFILVTAAPSALLPTILSRCQGVRFGLLGETSLRMILGRHGRNQEEAAAAAVLAGGSAERALAVDVAHVLAKRERIVQEAWGGLDSLTGLLERAEGLARDRAGFETALEILTAFSRDLAVAKVCGQAAPLVHADRREELTRWGAKYSMRAIVATYEAQMEAQRAVSRNANARFSAERMLFRMREALAGDQEVGHGMRGSR